MVDSKKWKALESAIARVFGTRRTPYSGSNSGVTHSDTLHDDIYVEAKCHKNQAILNLMFETEKLAWNEQKTPIIVLQDPEDEKKRKYIMLNIKDLKKIVKEMDIHYLDSSVPEGTTIGKMLIAHSSNTKDLLDMQEQLTIKIKQIMRDKIISRDRLEEIKSLSTLCHYIDVIIEYSKER